MALQATLRRVGRATLGGRAASGTAGAGPPPCRARPPIGPRAQRLVCCAPPPARRPPCTSERPPRPLTCDRLAEPPAHLKGESSASRFRDTTSADSEAPIPCCGERDSVARQLEAARAARRAEYEREVRERAASPAERYLPLRHPLPPPADPRLCARASDGRKYAVPCAPAAPCRCGPGRVPPPPSYVRLAVDDDNCRVKDSSYLDPCAHRPRIFIEVDRSVPPGEGKTPGDRLENAETVDAPPSPVRPPLSPIASEPKIGPSANETRCPRDPCDSRCAGKSPGHARRAGDRSWCTGVPRPPAGSPGPRSLHTSSLVAGIHPVSLIKRFASSTTACSTSTGHKLKSVLEQRTKLREAAHGRVVLHAMKEHAAKAQAPGAALELPVPAGVNHISVSVTLGGPDTISLEARHDPASSSPGSMARHNKKKIGSETGCVHSACSGRRDSWFSIKNIQKTIADCIPPPCKSSTPNTPLSRPCNPSVPMPPQPPPHNHSNTSNSPPCTPPSSPPKPPCTPPTSPFKPPCTPPTSPSKPPCTPLTSPSKPPCTPPTSSSKPPCTPPTSPYKSPCTPPTSPPKPPSPLPSSAALHRDRLVGPLHRNTAVLDTRHQLDC